MFQPPPPCSAPSQTSPLSASALAERICRLPGGGAIGDGGQRGLRVIRAPLPYFRTADIIHWPCFGRRFAAFPSRLPPPASAPCGLGHQFLNCDRYTPTYRNNHFAFDRNIGEGPAIFASSPCKKGRSHALRVSRHALSSITIGARAMRVVGCVTSSISKLPIVPA